MEKIELIQRIGDTVCEGCSATADCGVEPLKCQRINSAVAALDKYINAENETAGRPAQKEEKLTKENEDTKTETPISQSAVEGLVSAFAWMEQVADKFSDSAKQAEDQARHSAETTLKYYAANEMQRDARVWRQCANDLRWQIKMKKAEMGIDEEKH